MAVWKPLLALPGSSLQLVPLLRPPAAVRPGYFAFHDRLSLVPLALARGDVTAHRARPFSAAIPALTGVSVFSARAWRRRRMRWFGGGSGAVRVGLLLAASLRPAH